MVNDLSLEVRRGEVLTLLGPSGCGKSTTLRMIAGLEVPEKGDIHFQDIPWVSSSRGHFVKPQKRNVGLVFQNYAIWPHMSVAEHVAYPLRIRGFDKRAIEARCGELLEIVGLSGRGHAPAIVLSGGEQQRVAIARALATEPEILLLVEPFSNLDVALRDQMRLEIRSIKGRLGLTVVLVTHDQADAFMLSDTIAVMYEGHLEQVGTPEAIYGKPSTEFVRAFVGESIVMTGKASNGAQGLYTVELQSGARLQASSGESAAEIHGQPVTVWFRPEDLHVTTDEKGPRPGVLGGQILDRVFLGDRYKCRIRIDGAETVEAYVPVDFQPRKDQRVRLSIDARHVRIGPAVA